MSQPLKGRALAIVAGCAFAVGGLTILLDKDLTKPLEWQALQWLTILTVFGTIAAGHLMADAWRARHLFTTFGFLVLFLSGTGLVVYSSVGRQVETAGTTTLTVEDTNNKIADKTEDLKSAKARRDYAEAQVQKEMTGSRCGKRCADWKTNAADIPVVIEKLEGEIAALGPQKPVNAQAVAMADIAGLFGMSNKARTVAALTLVLPFLKTLFFEIGSIVSLGFAFRPRPAQIPTNDDAPQIPGNHNSRNSGPSKPPGSGRRGRKADLEIIEFQEKFLEKHGHAPSAGELKSAFPGIATSTAYSYAARSRKSA